MAFQQGLSGLNAAAKSLDVISNNVSNASNIGFKQSTTQFSDVYAAALNGAAAGAGDRDAGAWARMKTPVSPPARPVPVQDGSPVPRG